MAGRKKMKQTSEFSHINENIEILRRIAERGRTCSVYDETCDQVDLWQHMLDEIERLNVAVAQLD